MGEKIPLRWLRFEEAKDSSENPMMTMDEVITSTEEEGGGGWAKGHPPSNKDTYMYNEIIHQNSGKFQVTI